jgi:hypothetical protein
MTGEPTSSPFSTRRPDPGLTAHPSFTPAGRMRVGDAERSAAAERLSAHAAAGRLTVEELEERLELVHKAVVVDDLAAVQTDLQPQPRPRATVWRPALTVLGLALVVFGVIASIAVGHPIPPPFIVAAVLLWRVGIWRRVRYAPLGA